MLFAYESLVIYKMDNILNFVKEFGKGVRHPRDTFLKEGNACCKPLKPFGICDFDNEDFYHEPYSPFSCHIAGCNRIFETVIEYESHYNSCHSMTCKECGKNLPNSHFLDLHISETHDFFFKELAKRKPMYKCFLEECKESFKTPQERKDHCIKIHKFPSDFRYAITKKKGVNKKKKNKANLPNEESMDTDNQNQDNIDLNVPVRKNVKAVENKYFTGFSFGRGKSRKPVFSNFSKDLMKSLPDS